MAKAQKVVLDSYALLSFLFKERGAPLVVNLLEWGVQYDQNHLITAVNWTEIHYIVERKTDRRTWLEVKETLARLPIELIPVDYQLAERAAEFKIKGGLSLADCFTAALAKQRKLPVCTGDPEFHAVESEIEIMWL